MIISDSQIMNSLVPQCSKELVDEKEEEDTEEEEEEEDDGSSSSDDSEYLPSDEVVPPSDDSNVSVPIYPHLNQVLDPDMGVNNPQDTLPISHGEVNHGPSSITVKTTCNSDGRKYDKKQICFYCEKPQSKLPRHLRSAHPDESAVRDWMDEKDAKVERAKLSKLRNLGNHLHNCKVLEDGHGQLLVKYRPTESMDPKEFVPCPSCYGYFSKKFLWKHSCPLEAKIPSLAKKTRGQRVRGGKLLLPNPCKLSTEIEELLSKLNNDEVARVIKSDDLILKLAKKEHLKLGHDGEQQSYMRTKLREIARLLMEVRVATKDPNQNLTELIDPAKYDVVVSSARTLAGFDSSNHLYKVPSLALKIGHTLKSCALILKAEALKTGDDSVVCRATKFLQLYEMKWGEDITVHAHRTLTEKKRNNPKRLPLAQDIFCLTTYLKESSEVQKQVLKQGKGDTFTAWKTLNELTLTEVMMFNRRRQGEISKMTIHDFNNRRLPDSVDCSGALSEFEKELCVKLKRVEIVGKKGRTVPVILTGSMEESMSLLLYKREEIGVNSDNYFMFPRGTCNSEGHIRGSDCIRKYALLCGAKQPSFLRSTSLRKQIATVSQVLNLKENELDILANFLGHDVKIHREYYRLPDATLQVAKISKLLLSLENGSTSQLAGKSLSEIEVGKDEGK